MSGDIVERIKATLDQQAATRTSIDGDVCGRVKSMYSIWTKLRRQEIDIGQLYDYLAFRIVTASLKDYLRALGIIHQMWRPVPGRIKDYIAMPKPNFYQSLHTTVVAEKGQPFEVQIRTREMDLIAEQGIAAHWKYKEGRVGAQPDDHELPLAAAARGVAAGDQGSARLPALAEDRPLSGRGLHVHAEGRRLRLPARRDAARLRLPHPHRRRPPLRRRARERQARAAAHDAEERRHRRGPHRTRRRRRAASG